MIQVSLEEATERFEELVDLALSGELVLIERADRPTVQMVRIENED